jgi:Putative MetA-pathway of phenol degradation
MRASSPACPGCAPNLHSAQRFGLRLPRDLSALPLLVFVGAAVAVVGGIPFSPVVDAGSLKATVPAPQTASGSSPQERERWPENQRQYEKQSDTEPTAEEEGAKTLLESIRRSKGRQQDREGPEQEGRLDPDRPHFPEASTTVGRGRVVLESGYTFSEKRSSFFSHSFPEAVLRVGMFSDWFEFRIGQNFLSEHQTAAGSRTSATGAQDLYLGVKVALTAQKQYLPGIALIPQVTVPTGSRAVTAGKALPGLNVDCAWEVIDHVFNIELLVATNAVRDDIHRSHVELATGLTGALNVTPKLEAFVEWDAFYPVGVTDSGIGPRHYAVGGFVYFITKNLAVDIRAGLGLNGRANDVLAGTGFAVRY